MRQNDRKISVIIGNPPYNANQQNENDNNKNREYPAIDKRIKDTYIKESTAQKTKVYDMYARFLRWASDRISDKGIIAFITNNSFINARTFDGFRKVVQDEFDYIYVIDLGGNIRAGDTTGNVFNIMVGVAILFFVKKSDSPLPEGEGLGVREKCQIFYNSLTNLNSGQEKLQFLASHKFEQIHFEHIQPDQNNNWINLAADNDFDSLLPLANKETKLAKKVDKQKAIFKLYTSAVKSNRDDWVYDYDLWQLVEKIKYFIKIYNQDIDRSKQNNLSNINNFVNYEIKWSETLKKNLSNFNQLKFDSNLIVNLYYRPFVKKNYYSDKSLSDRLTFNHYDIFGKDLQKDNLVICLAEKSVNQPFYCLVSNIIMDYHFTGDSQCLPLYTYDEEGNKQENITDWGLQQFRDYYQPSPPHPPSLSERGGRRLSDNSSSPHPVGEGLGVRANFANGEKLGEREITKLDIFHYIYAVLHNPKYREKYELNLKRDFPRIPFYEDFYQWVKWGKQLMELHLNYESITPYQLKRIDLTPPNPPFQGGKQKATLSKGGWGVIKPKLKADKTKGQILIDEVTTLENVPNIAWEYQLGNRSAIEWILDQYKEKKPKDQTIAEKFNNYHFADYKEQAIDLLMRVTTVSVETVKIIKKIEIKETEA